MTSEYSEKLINGIDTISDLITDMTKDADKKDYTAQLSLLIAKNVPSIARAITTMDKVQAMMASAEAIRIIVADNPEAKPIFHGLDFGKTLSIFITAHALIEYYLSVQKEEGAEAPSL